MDVAALSTVPVGVRWWRSPDPTLTVIVKASFSLATDGRAPLASNQEPLCGDEPFSEAEADDLRHASDFAPMKARADVVVTGHVWSRKPVEALPGAFSVDHLERRFHALTSAPVTSLPLLARYLRVGPTVEAAHLRVGPVAARDTGCSGQAPEDTSDFSRFNVAPPEQQLELLRSSARLTLDWLIPGTRRRKVRLPGVRPKVFYVPVGGDESERGPQEVLLQCDTLWIDTELAVCTLCWRGVIVPGIEPGDRGRGAYLAVALQPEGLEHTWESIRQRLGSAMWVRAVEPHSPLVPASWVRCASVTDALPAARVLPGARPIDDEEGGRTETSASVQSVIAAEGALPFQTPAAGQRPPAAMVAAERARAIGGQTATLDRDAVLPTGILPFDGEGTERPPDTSGEGELAAPAPPVEPTEPADVECHFDGADDEEPSETAVATARQPIPVAGGTESGPMVAATPTVGEGASADAEGAPLSEEAATLTGEDDGAQALADAEYHAEPKSPAPETRKSAAQWRSTAFLDPAAVVPSRALPFTDALMNQMETLSSAPAIRPAAVAQRRSSMAGKTLSVEDRSQLGLVLPTGFGPAGKPPAPAPSEPSSILDPPDSAHRQAPAFGGAAPPPLPAPPSPALISAAAVSEASAVDGRSGAAAEAGTSLNVETYAAIKAEMWAGGRGLTSVLAVRGVDEAAWRKYERAQEEALAKEAKEGTSALSTKLLQALVRARQPPADSSTPELSLDDYVSLRAALDVAETPDAVLARHSLTAEKWQQLRRSWNQRALAEPALAKEIRAKLAAARRKGS